MGFLYYINVPRSSAAAAPKKEISFGRYQNKLGGNSKYMNKIAVSFCVFVSLLLCRRLLYCPVIITCAFLGYFFILLVSFGSFL